MSRARPTGISPYLLRQILEAQKEVEPPQNQLGIFRDTALHRADCRLAELDRTNPGGPGHPEGCQAGGHSPVEG